MTLSERSKIIDISQKALPATEIAIWQCRDDRAGQSLIFSDELQEGTLGCLKTLTHGRKRQEAATWNNAY